jgi:hypothetical protein
MAVDADALVRHGEVAMSARLQDLSRGGAALVAFAPPPHEARVTLELDGRPIAARVAWTAGRRFGLCFETPLRATDVLLFSRKGGSQPVVLA